MNNNYFDEFKCKEDLEREFQITLNDSVNILFAVYSYADYYGTAYVVFEENGKLYDVEGSHCSCYGLEDQFEPNETTAEALRSYVLTNTWRMDYYPTDARQALNDVVSLL